MKERENITQLKNIHQTNHKKITAIKTYSSSDMQKLAVKNVNRNSEAKKAAQSKLLDNIKKR